MTERIGRLFLPWIGILAASLAGLNKTVTMVDLPRRLAQEDIPLPSAMKRGIWRLNLADLAMVVDCLAEEAGIKASANREGKSTGFNSQQLSGQALSDKREEML